MDKLTRQYHDDAECERQEVFQEARDAIDQLENDSERGVDEFLTAEDAFHDIYLVQCQEGGREYDGEYYVNGWYWLDRDTDQMVGPFGSEHEAVVDSL